MCRSSGWSGAEPSSQKRLCRGWILLLLAVAGGETVAFGLSRSGAHAAEEWVEVESVEVVASGLAEVAPQYCSTIGQRLVR